MCTSRSQALVISDRAYCMLLLAYPAEFRRRYGPEMAQVFRTSCRAAYRASGPGGVARLWLPILWDWAWSAVDERFSCLLRRSMMKDFRAWFMRSKLITITLLFILIACLMLFCYIGLGVLYVPSLLGPEICRIEVDNQSGEAIRVTPIDPSGRSPFVVRIYQTRPKFPAFQQRNITVNAGDLRTLSYDCTHHGASQMYACDLEGECYVNKNHLFIYQHVQDNEITVDFDGFRFKSLESLPRPDEVMETVVQSFPEHDYTVLKYTLLCLVTVIALLGGFAGIVHGRR